jgi:hypothetical protein
MPVTVVQSVIAEDIVQVDGRRSITEHHTTSDGRLINVSYLAEPDADVQQRLTSRIDELNSRFASLEEEQNAVEE